MKQWIHQNLGTNLYVPSVFRCYKMKWNRFWFDIFKFTKINILETSIFCFTFFSFLKFKKSNISLIYKAIIVIFLVSLPIVNTYKLCREGWEGRGGEEWGGMGRGGVKREGVTFKLCEVIVMFCISVLELRFHPQRLPWML